MSKEGLRRGMMQILLANILNMLFSIGTNFLLPKYLSFDAYSEIKTYQLYITYVAILHFGYNDGMYLKFGGKTLNEVNDEEIQLNLSTLKVFQLAVMLFSVGVAIILKDIPLMMAASAILPQNMIAYFKNFYQAIGEFKRYSRIMNLTTGLTFFINISLITFIRTDNYVIYLIGYVLLSLGLWLTLEVSLHKLMKTKLATFKFSMKELKSNVSSGILLLLGNFSSQFLTSMDRWFVKVLLGNMAFAQYAFAVSMENFLNVAIMPVSVTMYNYFCNHDEEKDILQIRELIIAFATIIVAAAFPVKYIIEIFLQKYLNSSNVIFTLFAAQIFYIIIKSVYVNLYKARKMQNKYFSKLCFIVVIAFVFNIICYAVYHVKESFAIGTLLSAIVWFFLCQLDFRNLKCAVRHYIYIGFEVVLYIVCGYFFEAIVGGILYLLLTVIMLYFCIPYSLKKFREIMREVVKKIKVRDAR